MYTSVLCILMGALESATTSSNDFWTNTGGSGIPFQTAWTGIAKGTKIHSNSKITESIH